MILLCKKKFNYDKMIEYLKDSSIFNVLNNFCDYIRNNYELDDFYHDTLLVRIIEFNNNYNKIMVNYYKDFVDINNLCNFILCTCNHYFIINKDILPLRINNDSVVLDIILENFKKGKLVHQCSHKRNNNLLNLLLNINIRYLEPNNNPLIVFKRLYIDKINLDLIINQYKYCEDNHKNIIELLD
jgi:hypothetical protein